MRITIHIGPDPWVASRVQAALAGSREVLAKAGVLFPASPGGQNHTRAFMAVAGYVDTLRFNRGHATAQDQAKLLEDVADRLAAEVAEVRPDHLILSAHQFGTALREPSEMRALRDVLTPFFTDIDILAHVEAPARMLARHYAMQVFEGRARGLALERAAMAEGDWWEAALARWPDAMPERGIFPEVQGSAGFVDLGGLRALWDGAFGAGAMRFLPLDPAVLEGENAAESIARDFGLQAQLTAIAAEARPRLPSLEWLERARVYNGLVLQLLARRNWVLPRQLWRRMLGEMRVGGEALSEAHLADVTGFFAADVAALTEQAGELAEALRAQQGDPVSEIPGFSRAFRASQYLLANLHRIEAAQPKEATASAPARPSPHLPPPVQAHYAKLLRSPFAPHNRMGHVNEEALAAPFTPAAPRVLPEGSTGRVIVACMKNEAPYVVEWVAYHRAVGVDNFLIYTNGCEDGTSEILDRLDAMGVVHHRNNDNWKGNSPQQHALNQALGEPVVRQAEWLIHIDVDEFMNVRCGNGTLDDFLERVPGATNVAMTWRLFGHGGVSRLEDRFVIEQFEACAPKYCPKPHTVWGFKTMFRNIGAYEKLSCHRPNKLVEGRETDVTWVNGSGEEMDASVKRQGWRSSKKSIGYDLLQLNHYALRSAESFLIKRQRGRALHVDRSIGFNYWLRMDWGDVRDVTIQRNLPRLRAEVDRLMADKELARWHRSGWDWHRAKADELHGIPEFAELYEQALNLRLTETERVAYALSLDMET